MRACWERRADRAAAVLLAGVVAGAALPVSGCTGGGADNGRGGGGGGAGAGGGGAGDGTSTVTRPGDAEGRLATGAADVPPSWPPSVTELSSAPTDLTLLPTAAPSAPSAAAAGAPASRPADCTDVTPGGHRRTTCCPADLRALATPAEALAACPGAKQYLYEEFAEGEVCVYVFKRGDLALRIAPPELFEKARAALRGMPGFASLPGMGDDAFRMRYGKDLAPAEERYFVRAGARALSVAVRPRACPGPQTEALVHLVVGRFVAGAGGAPPAAPHSVSLGDLVPGVRDATADSVKK
ncbi:MAG TPA: hypothetical protein VG389_27145 [Myxococcota bacterium]|nr:hypothetical protein [Myxococcota bacterium]